MDINGLIHMDLLYNLSSPLMSRSPKGQGFPLKAYLSGVSRS